MLSAMNTFRANEEADRKKQIPSNNETESAPAQAGGKSVYGALASQNTLPPALARKLSLG